MRTTRLVDGPRDGETVYVDPLRITTLRLYDTLPGAPTRARNYCVYEYNARRRVYVFVGLEKLQRP